MFARLARSESLQGLQGISRHSLDSEARQGRHGEFEGAQPLHQAPSGAARSAGGKHRYLHENSHRRSVDGYFRGDSRIRTGDPLLAKQVLYQLSYTPEVVPGRR